MPVPASPKGAADAEAELLKAQLLKDVVEHAVRETRAVMSARPMESYRGRPFVLAMIALVSVSLATYSYLARAEWVFGPARTVSVPGRREGQLRFAMFLTAQRLLEYQETHNGALPESLLEIGEDWPDVAYQVVRGDSGAVFELRAPGDSGRMLTLRSDRDAAAFVALGEPGLREPIR